MAPVETNPEKQTRLSEEQMEKAVEQIVFDLGVCPEQAREWAEEAQEKLLNERNIVTREVVVVKVDTKHLDDEDVPAEFVPRSHEAKSWGDIFHGVIAGVKESHPKEEK